MGVQEEKQGSLRKIVREMGSILVAFSGGVDSTLLLKVAHEELGDRAAAITIDAPFHSRHEIDEARRLAQLMGVRHFILHTHDLKIEGLDNNPPDRCYICKKEVFGLCLEMARQNGFAVLADGSNVDDLGDYRPGRKALEELGVRSPLLEAGLTKAEIRANSRDLGLDTWEKPALACLLTRFPHGEEITPQRLNMVEQCENYLREKGFGLFRVRAHGETARIEVTGDELSRLVEAGMREEMTAFFHKAGFAFVTVDMDGYRCGSMNPPAAEEKSQI
ncbi:ATP-dependent sacrificial sulfur transferase LarE [Pelotalea chapellei]|uniref:ATP-dependent sacrificial sulfur transferase LarE n=1 Tax=Pelotalea chapellei TaxID=44671 RepID=A0ABS5UAF5_9BACT|nr:ATP-dependent sacrificial sulfur transferase LarE [Pelotalea chapellei]MBT1072643.1 ATP-dependent sacrificial sulfur transferase LarE [Pelotalea chapellei]